MWTLSRCVAPGNNGKAVKAYSVEDAVRLWYSLFTNPKTQKCLTVGVCHRDRDLVVMIFELTQGDISCVSAFL
jgi:hypothetical protein